MKKSGWNFILCCLIGAMVMGCSSSYYRKRADYELSYKRYYNAVEDYKKALKHNGKSAEILGNMAFAYMKMGQYQEAELLYSELSKINNKDSAIAVNYGTALIENGKPDQARTFLANYISKVEGNSKAEFLLDCCNQFSSCKKDSTEFIVKPVNIPEMVNAFSPVPFRDGILFSGEVQSTPDNVNPWSGLSYQDLYFSKKQPDGTWSSPYQLPGEVNSKFHEATVSINDQHSQILFTRSNYKEGELFFNDQKINHLMLFQASYQAGEWVNITDLPFNNRDYSVGHPSLSRDGSILFFVSDKPGGFGGSDIYYSIYMNSKWTEPINAGSKINTPGNEVFPFLSDDRELYFSSDGHTGVGGLDLFMSKFKGDSFEEPKNLGYPMNSSRDDFGINFNKGNQTGYFSSSRNGNDQIFEFEKFIPVFNVMGVVYEKGTTNPLKDITINLFTKNGKFKEVVKTNEKGEYQIPIMNDREYSLTCTGENCFKIPAKELSVIDKKKSENFIVDFEVEKIQIDKPIVIPNIYYDLGKYDLNEISQQGLKNLVRLMTENPGIIVELSSHTDCRANDKFNMTLSQKRAQSAVDFIISMGIDKSRIIAKGYGETKLLNECADGVKCPEELHTLNRRTEFKVVKINQVASGH